MDIQFSLRRRRSERGFTIAEMVMVTAVVAIMATICIPQVLSARRLVRAAGVVKDLAGGLRDARQMAITRRRAVTFQYDDATKTVKIIDHGVNATGLGNSGTTVLEGNYPNTTGSTVADTMTLTTSGLPASEIKYGPPPDATSLASTLDDKIVLNTLTNQKLNITFQPDGSVIGLTGLPKDSAIAIYSSSAPKDTAAAISILGATGRIKTWRYSSSAKKFVE